MVDRLLGRFIDSNLIDEENEEIYRFGIEILLLKFLHYIIYLLVAIFFHEIIGTIIFLISFKALRKNAGGYHAETKGVCFSVSCLSVFNIVLWIKIIPEFRNISMLYCMILIVANIIIFIFAPLGNKNRKLERAEIKYFKSRTRYILVAENMLWIGIALCGKNEYVVPIVLAIVEEAIMLLLEKYKRSAIKY